MERDIVHWVFNLNNGREHFKSKIDKSSIGCLLEFLEDRTIRELVNTVLFEDWLKFIGSLIKTRTFYLLPILINNKEVKNQNFLSRFRSCFYQDHLMVYPTYSSQQFPIVHLWFQNTDWDIWINFRLRYEQRRLLFINLFNIDRLLLLRFLSRIIPKISRFFSTILPTHSRLSLWWFWLRSEPIIQIVNKWNRFPQYILIIFLDNLKSTYFPTLLYSYIGRPKP